MFSVLHLRKERLRRTSLNQQPFTNNYLNNGIIDEFSERYRIVERLPTASGSVGGRTKRR